MELSALAGQRPCEGGPLPAGGRPGPVPRLYPLPARRGPGGIPWPGCCAGAMLCRRLRRGSPAAAAPPCRKVFSGVHPDVAVISGPREGKPITVDQVRALRSDAYIPSQRGERKIYLLEQADRMNQSAQNAMLKLLEEGPGLCGLSSAGGKRRRAAPDGALPV